MVGGYVNVAQIQSVANQYVYVGGKSASFEYKTGDATPEAFLKRIEDTCGGKSK